MGFNDILSKLFGNKAQRDAKEFAPYVTKANAAWTQIAGMDNDGLRAKTEQVKQQVQDYVADEKNRVDELRASIENLELDEREKVWNEIDKIEKDILEKYEKVLEDVLPEVFAIVKETARRFKENEETVVTANAFDRQLAVHHDFVRIEGDNAVYRNQWNAGGNEIVWDMVH
jgi:preprotein translocase subunit SecA